MSKWKKLSYERQKMLHQSAMMLVAKEGKAKGVLNFDDNQLTCPDYATFTVYVGEGITGTVTVKSYGNKNWASVVLDLGTVFVESFISIADGCLKINWPFWKVYSRGGIPDAIKAMALYPLPMDEVLA